MKTMKKLLAAMLAIAMLLTCAAFNPLTARLKVQQPTAAKRPAIAEMMTIPQSLSAETIRECR